jgi:hypothetical protein
MGNRLTTAWLQRHGAPVVQRDKEAGGRPDAPRSNDEGGGADVTTLEHDMRDVLIEWQIGANEGVNQFVTNTLSDRLDQIESGSWNAFIAGLIGNTLWAATTFLPVALAGKVVFAISMAGIGIAADPTVPHKSHSAIPEVAKLATTYVNSIFAGLNGQLRDKASALLGQHPDATRYRAIAAMVRNSFAEGMYDVDPTYARIPQISQNAVRDAFVAFATERLTIVTTVGEMWTETHPYERGSWSETKVVEVAWVQGSPEHPPRLATMNTQFEGDKPPRGTSLQDNKYGRRTFLSWVSPDNKDAAIEQWVTKRGQQPATYKAEQIDQLSG